MVWWPEEVTENMYPVNFAVQNKLGPSQVLSSDCFYT